MGYILLDTDAVIDQLKGFPATVALLQQLHAAGGELCVCLITIAEVYAGLDPRDRPRAQQFLDACSYLATSPAIARQAGEWRYQYRRHGIAISLTDALIAATAHAHQARLVTGNIRHYPMPGLSLVSLPRPGRSSSSDRA
jgi:predicted nucleic acid-binding protein